MSYDARWWASLRVCRHGWPQTERNGWTSITTDQRGEEPCRFRDVRNRRAAVVDQAVVSKPSDRIDVSPRVARKRTARIVVASRDHCRQRNVRATHATASPGL